MTIANVQITEVLLKRGNIERAGSYVGPVGEVVIDTTLRTLRIQDGVTPGGISTLPTQNDIANVISAIEGIQSNVAANVTANVDLILANISSVNLTSINANITAIQQELSATGSANIGNLFVTEVVFASNAAIFMPGNGNDSQIQVSGNSQNDSTGVYFDNNGLAALYANTSVQIYSGQSTVNFTDKLWNFDQTGNLTLPGNIIFADTTVQNTAYPGSAGFISSQAGNITSSFDGSYTYSLHFDNYGLIRSDLGFTIQSGGNQPVTIAPNGSTQWQFALDGVHFPDNTLQTTAYQGPAGQTDFATQANVVTANVELKSYVDNKIALLANAPAILDTLGQIATAIQNDEGNIGTILTGMVATNANVAAANIAWQANAAAQQVQISTLQTEVYSNANANSYLTTYLPTYTGNLTAGNLTVTGNINYVGNVNTITVVAGEFLGSAAGFGALYAGILSGYTYQAQTVLQNSTNFNGYAQVNHQNINSGTSASTDYVATADTGTAGAGYIDMGINSSGFVGGPGNELNNALDGYLYVQGTTNSNGNLLIGTASQTDVVISTAGFGTGNQQARFKNNVGLIIYQTTAATSTGTGALQVAGGAGIAGNLFAGNVLATGFFYANGTPFVSGGSSYGNTQVAQYLAANPVTTSSLVNGSYTFALQSSGYLTVPTSQYGTAQMFSSAGVPLFIGTLDSGNYWQFKTGGVLQFPDNSQQTTAYTGFGNANVAAYLAANPQGSTYSNANVASYFNSSSEYTFGNATPAVTTQSNAVSILIGNVSGIHNGFGNTQPNATVISNNIYANVSGTYVYRVSGQGAATISMNGGSIYFGGTSTTGNAGAPASTSTIMSVIPSLGVYSYLPITLSSGATSIQTSGLSSSTFSFLTSGVTTFNGLTAAYNINLGAGNLVLNVGGGTGNITAGNITATHYGNTIGTTATYTGNIVAPNYLFANGVNILSTVGGTYSNANVAAYLVANPQTGTYSNSNVTALLSNNISSIGTTGNLYVGGNLYITGNIVTSNYETVNHTEFANSISATGNVSTTANVISPGYLFANGVNILSTVAWPVANTTGSSGPTAIAIGLCAGSGGNQTIAIGRGAGSNSQSCDAVAIGVSAGQGSQGSTAIAIGPNAATTNQGQAGIAIGYGAGQCTQTQCAVAIGRSAGQTTQGREAVAVGVIAGENNQGSWAVAIGSSAGTGNQGIRTVAIGVQSGQTNQGTGAVSVGAYAGCYAQGQYAIAIGAYSGQSSQPSNSIVINASGNQINGYTAGFFVNPVRNDTSNVTNAVYFNTTTSELTYGPASSGSFGNAQVAAYLTGNITTGNITTGNILTNNYLFANGVNILSTVSSGSGTTYSNANVVSMLSANSAVFIGNVNTYPLLSNVTQVLVGNNTIITSGNALYPGSTSLLWNAYFAANGAALVRNTETGTGLISMDPTGITLSGYTSAVTANAIQSSVLSQYLKMNSTIGAVFSGAITAPGLTSTAAVTAPGLTSTAAVAVNSASGITTNQTTFILANATATTTNIAGASTSIYMGAYNSTLSIGNGNGTVNANNFNANLGTVTAGNITVSSNITVANIITTGTYGNITGANVISANTFIAGGNISAAGSSGPQMRFEWDTWLTNGNTAIAAMTPAGTLTGNATWDANVAYGIDLTSNISSQTGSVYWNSSTVNYNNNMTISGSFGAYNGSAADGYGIFFGSNANITSSTYSSSYGILVFCHYYTGDNRWEVYTNGTQTNYPFVQPASYTPSGISVWNATAPIFNDISIKINYYNGKRLMEVYLNNSHQFTQDITSWTPVGNYFGATSYTGGAYSYNLVRSLRVWW